MPETPKQSEMRKSASSTSFFSQSFGTTWRKALVSLPRVVPTSLSSRYIASHGPHPFILKLPSSPPGKHSIPVHIFLQLPGQQDEDDLNIDSGRKTPKKSGSLKKTGSESPKRAPSLRSSKNNSGIHTPINPSSSSLSIPIGDDPRRASSLEMQRPPPTPGPTQRSAAQWQKHRRPLLNLPVIIDFHGGSFILGSPSEQAAFCARMARNLGTEKGCVVISVDYRLGPYSQFPAANEDAEDIIRAVLHPDSMAGRILREDIRQHVDLMCRKEWVELDLTRLAISGFSSGGNLALNCVLSSQNDPTIGKDWPSVIPQEHKWPVPLLLFYPSLDARLLPDERPRPEGLNPPTGFFASLKIETELMPKYLPKAMRAHPRASPGLADIRDGGLHDKARMLLILPELDSLSEQSNVWVNKVRDDGRGSDLEVVSVKGEMHGWTQFPDGMIKSEESRRRKYECFDRAEEFVRQWWYDDHARVGDTTYGRVQ